LMIKGRLDGTRRATAFEPIWFAELGHEDTKARPFWNCAPVRRTCAKAAPTAMYISVNEVLNLRKASVFRLGVYPGILRLLIHH
jgi:hypothetical protein